MADATSERGSYLYTTDWTVDPETGRSNSSPEFEELSEFVGEIIRDSAHSLILGGYAGVGRLIMAQLAHRKNVGPLPSANAEAPDYEI